MRILVFNWRDICNPLAGGAEVNLHELCKRMIKDGHSVTITSSRYQGCKDEEWVDGIRILRCGNWITYMFKAPLKYIKELRKVPYDIIIEDISKTPLFTPLYVRKPLLIIWHHRSGSVLFKMANPIVASVVYVMEVLIPLLYSRQHFVVVSPSTKEELTKFGMKSEKIRIIYNGVTPPPSLASKAKYPVPTIAYFGRVVKYKQPDHVLNAFRFVKDKIPNARLIIAGRGDFHNSLMAIAAKLRVQDSVEFKYEISDIEKYEILANAWVYVIPSAREGWAISVIEASLCETPTIAYDVPGLRDSVVHGKTGLLVKPGKIKDLASSIIRLLEQPALRENLGKQAAERASYFSWEKAYAELKEELEKLVP